MKVIFLDIDGVMNNRTSLPSNKHENLAFDDTAVSLLLQLIHETDAKIVLTSTWRLWQTVERLKERVFQHYQLADYLIGFTPVLSEEIRGREIQQYLNQHPEVTHFVILDDESDMGDLFPFLVQTNPSEGFREIAYQQALKTINQTKKRKEELYD